MEAKVRETLKKTTDDDVYDSISFLISVSLSIATGAFEVVNDTAVL